MPSLESIPQYLADFFDISLGAAQVLLSSVVILAILVTLMWVSKGKYNLLLVIMLFITQGFLVAIGWFPAWFMFATIVILAFMIAKFGTDGILGMGD